MTAGGARRALIVAGGTGGHIYPALALGRAMEGWDDPPEILYCCGSRKGEQAIYSMSGVSRLCCRFRDGSRAWEDRSSFWAKWAAHGARARRMVRDFKPDLAVGFGNYLSVPAILAAKRAGAAVALHEQNALPGAANRFLARFADQVLTGVEPRPGTLPEGKTLLVGNPVRAELFEPIDKIAARRELGLAEEGPLCLCFGGRRARSG